MKESIKVYVQLEEHNCISNINSELFIDDFDDWTEIDEGIGIKYAHAQNNYFNSSICDEFGRFNFKVQDGLVIALTEEEKKELFPSEPIQPTDIDILKDENKLLKAQFTALSDRGDFVEDLIAEMAVTIYA